jgi:hypothetical protein
MIYLYNYNKYFLLSFFLDEKERKNQDCLKKHRKSTELPTTDKKNSPAKAGSNSFLSFGLCPASLIFTSFLRCRLLTIYIELFFVGFF